MKLEIAIFHQEIFIVDVAVFENTKNVPSLSAQK